MKLKLDIQSSAGLIQNARTPISIDQSLIPNQCNILDQIPLISVHTFEQKHMHKLRHAHACLCLYACCI